jgi:hypothetical protein
MKYSVQITQKHFISLNYLGNIISDYKHATCNIQSWQQNVLLSYFVYKWNGAGVMCLVKIIVYHPGVFLELNKMVFTSQTHLLFVLNVLFGQLISTRYWVIIRPLHKKQILNLIKFN